MAKYICTYNDIRNMYGIIVHLKIKKMLDSVHVEAARIITRGTELCSTEDLFADLGWETLQERRNNQTLLLCTN